MWFHSRDQKSSLPSNGKAFMKVFLQLIFVSFQVLKGEPPQQPVCVLNIVLPEDIIPETSTAESTPHKYSNFNGNEL